MTMFEPTGIAIADIGSTGVHEHGRTSLSPRGETETRMAPPRALVFPGQGSQAVGMGRDLAEAFPVAREVFQEVDDALGQHLFRLMCEGPDKELLLTENAQPAILSVGIATLRVLESEGNIDIGTFCRCVAGHSLGEYTALTAARAFRLADAVRLVKTRGRAMQKAVPVGEGAMAALMGLDLEAAKEVAAEAASEGVCQAANDNGAGQIVISGIKAAIERAIKIATGRGAKRSILLPVSAPFHCALMKPAADAMAEALEQTHIKAPVVPVVSNVTAGEVRDPAEIKTLLVQQVTHMVRWRESVSYLRGRGIASVIEIGTGKVLSGLSKRIERDLEASSVGSPAEIEVLLKSL